MLQLRQSDIPHYVRIILTFLKDMSLPVCCLFVRLTIFYRLVVYLSVRHDFTRLLSVCPSDTILPAREYPETSQNPSLQKITGQFIT